jgi:hypothetical protein
MEAAAFNAYLMGAGSRNTYNQFLKHLGLSEEETKLTKVAKKALIQRAEDVVSKITKMKIIRRKKK